MTAIASPYSYFTDRDGSPLEGGYLYFGTVNLPPETNPIQVYWDTALTIPAAQPIRTKNGYPYRNGTPSAIFAADDYSITVKNSKLATVFTNLAAETINSTALTDLANTTDNAKGDALIGFKQSNAAGFLSGASSRTVNDKLQEQVSVFDFAGTTPPASGADWTAIIQTADNTAYAAGKALYFPAYIYGISNVGVLRSGCDWIGEEPSATSIKALAQTFSPGTNYGAMITCANRNNVRTTGLTFDFTSAIIAAPATAVVTASISAGDTGEGYIVGAVAPVMTVTAVGSGTLAINQPISGTGIDARQFIIALGTGTGGVGTYKLGIAQVSALSSRTVTQDGNVGTIVCALQMWLCNSWTVENCRFIGIQTNTIGLAVNGGNYWAIRTNYFNMPTPTNRYNQAINVSTSAGPVSGYEISNNSCYGTGIFSNGQAGRITNNFVTTLSFGAGIALGPISTCIFNTVSNNYCDSGTGLDINQTFPAGIENWSGYSVISNNICAGNSGQGISHGNLYSAITNNFCLNNGQLNGSGITLYSIDGFPAQHCTVSGNVCTDNQGSPTQNYGIAEYSVSGLGVSSNVITGNVLDGNKLGTTLLQGGNADGFIGPVLSTPVTAGTPGTIASAGIYFVSDVFVLGAALGDVVTASYDQDLQRCTVSAFVASANSVTFTIYNGTGASKTLTAGNFKGAVMKRPGYVGLP